MMSRAWLSMRRLILQLTADRRRFAIFCGLLAVGMLFWTRLIVIQDMPRVAMADPSESTTSMSENNPLSNAAITKRVVLLPEGPIRNPFRVNPNYYPVLEDITETPDEDSKSEVLPTDIVRSALMSHRLEAVMGAVAVVSGQTCRVGASVRDLTGGGHRIELAEVRERSVVIQCGDVQCVLRLD
ncbi:MAG: hypothetical protein VX527_04620 [Planctomycetota bacterium]|nr:hypothetical protein [Planctomycetota bacterium]